MGEGKRTSPFPSYTYNRGIDYFTRKVRKDPDRDKRITETGSDVSTTHLVGPSHKTILRVFWTVDGQDKTKGLPGDE